MSDMRRLRRCFESLAGRWIRSLLAIGFDRFLLSTRNDLRLVCLLAGAVLQFRSDREWWFLIDWCGDAMPEMIAV